MQRSALEVNVRGLGFMAKSERTSDCHQAPCVLTPLSSSAVSPTPLLSLPLSFSLFLFPLPFLLFILSLLFLDTGFLYVAQTTSEGAI